MDESFPIFLIQSTEYNLHDITLNAFDDEGADAIIFQEVQNFGDRGLRVLCDEPVCISLFLEPLADSLRYHGSKIIELSLVLHDRFELPLEKPCLGDSVVSSSSLKVLDDVLGHFATEIKIFVLEKSYRAAGAAGALLTQRSQVTLIRMSSP